MPAAAEDRPWFSVDIGPLHLLQYSTEHAFHPGSEQHAFMAAGAPIDAQPCAPQPLATRRNY